MHTNSCRLLLPLLLLLPLQLLPMPLMLLMPPKQTKANQMRARNVRRSFDGHLVWKTKSVRLDRVSREQPICCSCCCWASEKLPALASLSNCWEPALPVRDRDETHTSSQPNSVRAQRASVGASRQTDRHTDARAGAPKPNELLNDLTLVIYNFSRFASLWAAFPFPPAPSPSSLLFARATIQFLVPICASSSALRVPV